MTDLQKAHIKLKLAEEYLAKQVRTAFPPGSLVRVRCGGNPIGYRNGIVADFPGYYPEPERLLVDSLTGGPSRWVRYLDCSIVNE